MSNLEKKIEEDIIRAMKEKDVEKLSALRLLKAALKEKSIMNNKEALKDEDVIQVIKGQINQIKDSIEAFKKGNRDDLLKKEEIALLSLRVYLPPEASPEEIKKCVKEVMDELKPEGKKDFGRVMGEVMKHLKGKADGKKVSKVLSEELSKIEKKD